MSKRPYFPVYHEDIDSNTHLSDGDLGKLIRMLYDASLGGEPEVPKRLLSAYNTMVKKVQKDAKAYNEKVEKYRINANKRWEERNAMASNGMQSHVTQLNSTQLNSTQHSTSTVHANDRDDDMNDVLDRKSVV